MKNIYLCVAIAAFMFIYTKTDAQLMTTNNGNAAALAAAIVGPGIQVSNETMVCPTGASGTFSNGNTTNIGITNGVIMATGRISDAVGPNNAGNTTTSFGGAGDADLSALSGFITRDACKLEFDFEAIANKVSISFVFASEEYLEWVNTQFNDVFGFLVTGPNPAGGNYTNFNIATIPVNIPITINTINHLTNTPYFIHNPGGPTIEYDGFTVRITASLDIVPCAPYHFKLAIADGSDFAFDSGIFLEEAGFESSIECQDFELVLGPDGTGSITPEDLIDSDLDLCNFVYSLSQSDFTCADAGDNLVTVTAIGGNGDTLTCQSTVTVVVPADILTIDLGDECRQVYFGYGPESCTTITANVTGGTAPYTYLWSNGATTSSITVCPGSTTSYSVIVTDANGCLQVSGRVDVNVTDVRCGNNNDKVLVCHIPPDNPGNSHTICISASAVAAHLAHGCQLGNCSDTDPCAEEPDQIVNNETNYIKAMTAEPELWPNPGNGRLQINFPDNIAEEATIKVSSIDGKIVGRYIIQSNEKTYAINDLNDIEIGVYYVQIDDISGQQWILKWIKTK